MQYSNHKLSSRLTTVGYIAVMAVITSSFYGSLRGTPPKQPAAGVEAVLKQVAVIDLPGPVGRKVWVNLQDQDVIAEIDSATDTGANQIRRAGGC